MFSYSGETGSFALSDYKIDVILIELESFDFKLLQTKVR